MLNEKPHNDFDWRSRLGELDDLPDDSALNKNESWDKLHDRLHNRNTKRKAVWYWVAAACLAIILTLPFINYKKENHFVKVNAPLEKDTVSLAKSLPSSIEKTTPSITVVTKHIPEEKKITGKLASPKQKLPGGTINRQSIDLSSANSIKENKQEDLAANIVAVDTLLSVAAPTVQVKKKLRVVHINELGQPVEENYKGRYADHQAIYLKLSNQNNTPYLPGATSTFAQDLLKIKLTPQN